MRGVHAALLIARLARVDNEVATGRHGRSEGDAGEDRAVLEGQHSRPEVPDSRGDDGARPGERRRDGRRGDRRGHGRWAADHNNGPTGRVAPWARSGACKPVPPSRPHGTGSPASQDRPPRTVPAPPESIPSSAARPQLEDTATCTADPPRSLPPSWPSWRSPPPAAARRGGTPITSPTKPSRPTVARARPTAGSP